MKKYKKKIFKGYLERVPPVDWKRLAVRSIPYVLIAYVCNRLSWLYQYCTGQTMFVRLYVLLANIKLAFANLMPSFAPRNLLIGALGGGTIYAIVRYKGMNAKKYRHGMEYGSARWDAYYLLKEVIYGRRRRKHYDPIQQDYRAVLPSFSR